MMTELANDEMIQGYSDGFADDRTDYPETSNRSASYRHGWLNGRDDRLRKPRDFASNIRADAEAAIQQDATT